MAVFFCVHFGHSVFCGSGQPAQECWLFILRIVYAGLARFGSGTSAPA